MAWVVIAWATASRGCVARSCTEMGCVDRLSATLRTADGIWPDGAYQFSMRVDGFESACTFRLPDKLPVHPGALTGLDCGPHVELVIQSETQCESGCDENACWQGCKPIPGKFVLHVLVDGTPSRVELSLVRDAQVLVAQDVEPAYRVFSKTARSAADRAATHPSNSWFREAASSPRSYRGARLMLGHGPHLSCDVGDAESLPSSGSVC